MKSIATLFSNIQTNINDIGGTRIMLAEYVDFAQRVADDLALKLDVWINNASLIPNPSTNPIYPTPNTLVIPATLGAVQLLRVVRGGIESREYSRSAVGSQGISNNAFTVNTVDVSNYDFYSTVDQNENMLLTFTSAFAADEIIYIEYLAGKPYTFTQWTQATNIPDFLCDVVEYGIKMRVMERLFDSGVESMEKRMVYAEKKYQKYLHEARSYTRNFHDRRSTPQHQPLRWLSDNRTMNPQFDL